MIFYCERVGSFSNDVRLKDEVYCKHSVHVLIA